jgi:site-specific DNA-methyltransferase (adenine-specific)
VSEAAAATPPAITILNCDCRDVDLTTVAAFDVMLVDPPYREHVHKSCVSQSKAGGTRVRDLGFEHVGDELRQYVAAAAAAVKRWSIIYSDAESLHEWRSACEAEGARYIRPIPWIRWSMPQLSGDRPTTGWELLTCYWGSAKGRKHWNGPGNLLVYRHEEADAPPLDELTHKCLRGDGKHKTEKPLDQMLDLVEFFSDPGETVFDPTAGSGTTALACAILGRNFVGCELDEKWAEFGQARADAYLRDGKLSDRDTERLRRYVAAAEARPKKAAAT